MSLFATLASIGAPADAAAHSGPAAAAGDAGSARVLYTSDQLIPVDGEVTTTGTVTKAPLGSMTGTEKYANSGKLPCFVL